jgi:pimeloyl-ACP methyl ester carboxylesterase
MSNALAPCRSLITGVILAESNAQPSSFAALRMQLRPPPLLQEMTGLVSGAVFKLVDPGAHLCNIENPEGFNSVVAEWLSR